MLGKHCRVFVCYARTDQAFVQKLTTALKQRVVDVWILLILYQECRIPRVLCAIQYIDLTSCDPHDQTVLNQIVQALPASTLSAYTDHVDAGDITATPSPASPRNKRQTGRKQRAAPPTSAPPTTG